MLKLIGDLPTAGCRRAALSDRRTRRANLIIDEATADAGRVPADVRRLYNISGSFTGFGAFLTGSPRQWVEQLTGLAITEGIGTFILASDDPR